MSDSTALKTMAFEMARAVSMEGFPKGFVAPTSKAHELALKHKNVEDAIAIHELTLDLKRANAVIAMLIQAGNVSPSMVQEIKAKAMDEVQS